MINRCGWCGDDPLTSTITIKSGGSRSMKMLRYSNASPWRARAGLSWITVLESGKAIDQLSII